MFVKFVKINAIYLEFCMMGFLHVYVCAVERNSAEKYLEDRC